MLIDIFIEKFYTFKLFILFRKAFFLLILLGNIYAQKNIVSISKIYDLDNDDLNEFIAIEKQNFDDEFGTSAVYYEVDEFGKHIELWRFTTTNQIVNATIGDVNGDGVYEILVMYFKSSRSFVEIFNWTGFDFSPVSSGLLYETNDFKQNNIPANFNLIDIDSDNVQEIVLSQKSPHRMISLYYISGNSNLTSIQDLASNSIKSGYSPILAYPFRSNADEYSDLIAISPEINRVKIQLYINNSGNFVESLYGSPKSPFPVLDVIQSGIIDVDIDSDGTKEIVLPLKNFKSVAIKKLISSYQIIPLPREIEKLFVFKEPLNDATINQLLLDRLKLSLNKNKIKQISLNKKNILSDFSLEDQTSPNILKSNIDTISEISSKINMSQLDLSPIDTNKYEDQEPQRLSEINLKSIKASSSIIDSIDTLFQSTQIDSIKKGSLIALSTDTVVINIDSISQTNINKIKPIQLNTLGVTPMEIPKSQNTVDTLYVNEPFTLSVKPTKGTIISFNPENLPMGAKFEQISKTITWIPVLSQIGLQSIKYSLIVEGAEKPSIDEIPYESLTANPSSSTETFEFIFYIKER